MIFTVLPFNILSRLIRINHLPVVILVKPLALATFVHCELESMGSEDDDLTPFDTVVVEEEDGVVVLE